MLGSYVRCPRSSKIWCRLGRLTPLSLTSRFSQRYGILKGGFVRSNTICSIFAVMELAKQLGRECKKLREIRKMTAQEVADAANISIRTVFQSESGQKASLKTYEKILHKLGCKNICFKIK